MLWRIEMLSLPAKTHRRLPYLSAILILFMGTSASVSDVSAQKKKPVKKRPVVANSIFTPDRAICIPPDTDYISVLQIDNNGKATLITQRSNGSRFLFDANLLSSANDVLTAAFKPTVTVKADPGLKFDLVVKILKGARQALDRCFNVEASTNIGDPYVFIYPEPKDESNVAVKPNPLMLVVRLDENANIALNNEKQGSINDTSTLGNLLKQIFKEREDNGAFREGTNLVEKEVRVMAASSAKFGDVIKIVDALKEAGASPVGLQIDDVAGPVEMRLEILQTELPKPNPRKP
jgi:biopolymer transport protein ExbD